MSKEPDIRVLVGVDGDVGIDKGSGKLISNTLDKIAKSISKEKTPEITFTVDVEHTTTSIQKQLDKIVKDIKINPVKLNVRVDQNLAKNLSIENESRQLSTLYKQKIQDAEATKRQTKETRDQEKAIKASKAAMQEVISSKQTQTINSIENAINRLGKTDLSGTLSEVRGLREALFRNITSLGGSNNLEDAVNRIAEDPKSENFKIIAENARKLNEAISKLYGQSREDLPLFTKDEKLAKQTRDLSEFEMSLSKFAKTNDKFRGDFGAAFEFERIESALADLQRRSKNGVDIGIDLDKLKKQTSEWKTALEAAGLTGQTAFGKIRAQMEKLGVYFSASAVIMGAVRQIKNMTQNVMELDSAMTELYKVTDETQSTYNKFFDDATVRAKKYGAVLSDVVNATADFARLGYSLSEASKLADTAVIYKNVGDGITDIGTASESVISTMKAFNVEADNSIEIVDKYNEVGNRFETSSAGIGTAMKKSASALAAANNTLDESIALITAANSVVQDPEVVGTAMKTMSMRIRGAKTELEDAGESTEGMAKTVSELRDSLYALSHQKVDIMLDEDTFKSTYQIIGEMSKAWEEMTDKEQAAALELMGGKRQGNVLASLIKNFDTAEDVVATASDSMGSAMRENQKYLDSIAGKSDKLAASFQTLSSTVIDSGLIKGLLDLGSGTLDFLNNITKITNTLPTLISLLSGFLSVTGTKTGEPNMPTLRKTIRIVQLREGAKCAA